MLTGAAGISSEITFFPFATKSRAMCQSVVREDGKKRKWEYKLLGTG